MEESTMNEPAMPDAGMMETNLDANLDANIDDLFGEAADGLAADSLGLPLPSLALPPELVSRITNTQTRACCTGLAWSNAGGIAQIKDRGEKIVFRSLLRSPQHGTWSLTEDSKPPLTPSDGARWEHVQFSNFSVLNNPGNDLAVADSLGRVFIYTTTVARPLGKMVLAHQNIARSESVRPHLDAVVGLHWIPAYPSEFRIPDFSQATKINGRWSVSLRPRDSSEPSLHHPVENQQALTYVSRDAKLTLMYQVQAVWHAADARLEDGNASMETISHADMCEQDDHLLVATHDLSKCIRLYKVVINWNATQYARQGSQSSVTNVAPTLDVARLTTLDHVTPQHGDAARLSLFRLVPAIPSNASLPDVPTFPMVLAIFTRASHPTDIAQQTQEAYSIISRWHVESAIPALHEAFSGLKKTSASTLPQVNLTVLKRQDDMFTGKLVLSFESQHFNTILAFAASDGTIDFRDRLTMASIEPYLDATTASNLSQSSFEHLMDNPCTQVAMSANGSALATLWPDDHINHKLMTLRYTWHPIMDDGGLIESAVVCLARQYSILCESNGSNDETLALLPLDLSAEMRTLFVKEVIRMPQRAPSLDLITHDPQRQQTVTLREAYLPKAMSAQLALGRKPGTMELSYAGKFAFAFLNTRLVATTLAYLFNNPQSFSRPDVLLSLRGMMKWGSDMLVYVADSIISIQRLLDSAPKERPNAICAQFIINKNNPVMHILFCTFSRIYLRFLVMGIPKFLNAIQRLIVNIRSPIDRQQLSEVYDLGASIPFKYTDFENLLIDVDTALRGAYHRATVPADRRTEIELSAICCELPFAEELHPAVEDIFHTALPKFMDKVDLAKLYFWDTSWLGIEPSREKRQYDIFRKMPVTKEMKLKTCRRCGAVTEDLSTERAAREPVPVPMQLTRQCVCFGYWILE